ncbi:MAG: DNA-directed RNA polymerase subunit H [Desulfurococcales archaeon]|nr:DNA-directed RNA polymerase subunit H [Desulfurococcales archaeon]MCE4605422.1 DNA-directed RNA polymerase subunit H [Desulfurococcales archaeon]
MPSKSRRITKKILKHELVPEHRILSLEEAVEVLRRYNVKPWNLPQISINDPVIKLLGGKPGDIVEIRRRSPTGGESVAYRIVVPF